MKKLTAILMAIALVAVGAIFVIGQTSDTDGNKFGKRGEHFGEGKRGGHSGEGRRGGKGMGTMFRGLDLTDAQKEQMKAIHQANFESSKSLRDQLKANHDELDLATANGKFNEAQIQAIASRQGVLHSQMIVGRERVKSQVFAILTPEQKTKAAEMKAKFEQKMQERKAKSAERKAAKDAQK